MSLKYGLLENLLTARHDDYTAQPQDVKSHDIADIIVRMVQKGSTITKTDILAVLNSFFETLEEITEEGGIVNTGLINTSFSIAGVFEEATDTFDRRRHSVRLNINPGKELREVLSRIRTEKTGTLEALPHILEVKDSVSGTVNERLTPLGVVEIIGSRLRIYGDSKSNGIAFVNAEGEQFKPTTLVSNKPAKLIAILPDLPTGEYTVQITTQYNHTPKGLKEPRTGAFNRHLMV